MGCQADFAEDLPNNDLLKMTNPENRHLPIVIIHEVVKSSIAHNRGLARKAFWLIRYEGVCNGIEGLGLKVGSGGIVTRLKT